MALCAQSSSLVHSSPGVHPKPRVGPILDSAVSIFTGQVIIIQHHHFAMCQSTDSDTHPGVGGGTHCRRATFNRCQVRGGSSSWGRL